MLSNMKLGVKLTLAFCAMIVIALVIGFVGNRGMNQIMQGTDALSDHYMPGIGDVMTVHSGQSIVWIGERGLLIPIIYKQKDKREAQYAYMEKGFKQADDAWKHYESIPNKSAEETKLWEAFTPLWEGWKKDHQGVVDLIDEKTKLLDSGLSASSTQVAEIDRKAVDQSLVARASYLKTEEALLKVVDYMKSSGTKAATTAAKDASSSRNILFSALAIGIVLAILLAVIFTKNVATILGSLLSEANRLSQAAINGQLTTRGDPEKVNHEFRGIVVGVNETLDAVINPLNVAADYVNRIAKGDIPPKIIDTYNGDFNTIKTNLNSMVETMNELLAETNQLIEATAAGRVSERADASKFVGEWGNLVAGINQMLDPFEETVVKIQEMVKQVSEASLQMAQVADNVGRASQEVAGGAQQVAEGATVQTKSATEVTENMEQLRRAIEEVARGVQVSAQGAEQATTATQQAVEAIKQIAVAADAARRDAENTGDVAKQGAIIVQETVAGMARVKQASTDSGEKINALGGASQKIGEIVEAINDIAEQTNLLALNAAIEAARAGEHGKGFAVVADEVRKLAERSASQTREIASLIRNIQEGIQTAVDSMTVATKEVEDGVDKVNNAGTALNDILSATDNVVSQVKSVSQLCEEVEKSSNEVFRVVDSVSTASEQSNAATEQMTASSTEVMKVIELFTAGIEQSSSVAEELSAAAQEQNASVEEMTASTTTLADLSKQTKQMLDRFTVDYDSYSENLKQTPTGPVASARSQRSRARVAKSA